MNGKYRSDHDPFQSYIDLISYLRLIFSLLRLIINPDGHVSEGVHSLLVELTPKCSTVLMSFSWYVPRKRFMKVNLFRLPFADEIRMLK